MGMSKKLLKGLLDNPNFKKWFGESAVRDAEGLPLEVYHGTANSFDTFAPTGMGAGSRESGLGHWFTENPDVADNFANFARSSDRAKSGPAIIPGNLKMENPWKPETYDEVRDLVDKFTSFERPGYMFRDRNIRMQGDKVDHAAAVDHLKSQGYDGIMLEKTRVDSPDDGKTLVNQYIALDPTQFKSRFNQGSFDPTDPNFLKSAGLMTAGAGAAYGMARNKDGSMSVGPGGAEAAAFPKRLWHATTIDKKPSIEADWLRAGVGDFVKDSYGMEIDPADIAGAVFASTKPVGWTKMLVGRKLGKHPNEVTQRDIVEHGLVAEIAPDDQFLRMVEPNGPYSKVLDPSQGEVEFYESGLYDYGRMREPPPSVEPGDYFATDDVEPRRLLGGEKLRDFLSKLQPQEWKKVLPVLAGTGAYGLMGGDSDANAMSYIGPKGMANFLGPDKAKALLSEAEQLAAKGLDNEAVRQATGVFKGMDGKWRYELDDSGASLTPWTKETHGQSNISWDKRPGPAVAMNTEDFISHPSLERAYWPTRDQGPDIFYQHVPGDTASRYVPSQDAIYMSAQSRNADKEGMGTALHELQHAIQQREGFAKGGSPSEFDIGPMFSKKAKDLHGDLSKYLTGAYGVPPKDILESLKYGDPVEIEKIVRGHGFDTIDDASKFLWDEDFKRTPYGQYQRLAGEIEARDTAKRMNLTPEQRRATPPDLRDNAIVRFDQNGPNEAAGLMGYNAPPRFSVDPKRVAAEALQDAYSPIDTAIAVLTGGGGLASRAIQAAVDPFMEYVPKIADAINPRNIITGLMR